MEEEEISYESTNYFNNKNTLDQVFNTSDGLFSLIDYSTKVGQSDKHFVGKKTILFLFLIKSYKFLQYFRLHTKTRKK